MITKEDFDSAEEGDAFVDVYGREWKVVRRRKNELLVRVDEETTELHWFKGDIVDEDWAVIPELKHTDAFLKKAGE